MTEEVKRSLTGGFGAVAPTGTAAAGGIRRIIVDDFFRPSKVGYVAKCRSWDLAHSDEEDEDGNMVERFWSRHGCS